ncbi:MAG: hypothetical protein HUK40_06825 [Desulfobacter sp.]|nr:hypothetical protein [Desulfobacter sp.]
MKENLRQNKERKQAHQESWGAQIFPDKPGRSSPKGPGLQAPRGDLYKNRVNILPDLGKFFDKGGKSQPFRSKYKAAGGQSKN